MYHTYISVPYCYYTTYILVYHTYITTTLYLLFLYSYLKRFKILYTVLICSTCTIYNLNTQHGAGGWPARGPRRCGSFELLSSCSTLTTLRAGTTHMHARTHARTYARTHARTHARTRTMMHALATKRQPDVSMRVLDPPRRAVKYADLACISDLYVCVRGCVSVSVCVRECV